MIDCAHFPRLKDAKGLMELVDEIGILPFFNSGIEGYSLEYATDPSHWFKDGVDGPWEWKCDIVQNGYAYGKLLKKKTCFMTPEWYGILACYRRDGYDFEGMYEDGLATHGSRAIVDALEEGSIVSTELRRVAGFAPRDFGKRGASKAPAVEGAKGFDSIIAVLQMQTFVTVSAFEYSVDRRGLPFGWGLARYILSDQRFGKQIERAEERFTPLEARELLIERIGAICPQAAPKQIERLIK